MKLSHFFRSPTSCRQLIDRPSFHPLALPRPRPLLSANEWALQGWTWRHISVGLFLLECRTPTHIFGLRAPHLLAPNSLRLGCSLRLFLPILLPFPVLFPGPRLALSGDCPCYSYILPFLLSRLFFSKIFCMSNPILVFALERPELTWKQKGNYEVVLIARILSVKERRHNIVLKKNNNPESHMWNGSVTINIWGILSSNINHGPQWFCPLDVHDFMSSVPLPWLFLCH